MFHLGSFAGDVTCMATIPVDMEVEACFLAKEDGIIAGIALAEMVFQEVDPSLKVKNCIFCLWIIFIVFVLGPHTPSFVHFGIRWSGLERMEIMFARDCSLEKFMVSQ